MDGGSHSWAPLEDSDPLLGGKASIRGGGPVARPTRLRFGRDHDLHVFVCLPGGARPRAPMGACAGRPPTRAGA